MFFTVPWLVILHKFEALNLPYIYLSSTLLSPPFETVSHGEPGLELSNLLPQSREGWDYGLVPPYPGEVKSLEQVT